LIELGSINDPEVIQYQRAVEVETRSNDFGRERTGSRPRPSGVPRQGLVRL